MYCEDTWSGYSNTAFSLNKVWGYNRYMCKKNMQTVFEDKKIMGAATISVR
jgi:hypothetical protein